MLILQRRKDDFETAKEVKIRKKIQKNRYDQAKVKRRVTSDKAFQWLRLHTELKGIKMDG